jgi:hypothetical protein
MKIFVNLQQMKGYPDLYTYHRALLEDLVKPGEDIETVLFENKFDGATSLIETDEDLKDIETLEDCSIAEEADPMDGAAWIIDEQYVQIMNGGYSWLVPREIALRYPTILESIRMNEPGYEGDEE